MRLRLDQMHLTGEVETKFPDELSGGMKKRVALARAMIQEPEIILFDEPVTGLDPPMTNTVFHLIKQTHQDSGYTALVVAHDIPEVFTIADQVAMLHGAASRPAALRRRSRATRPRWSRALSRAKSISWKDKRAYEKGQS